MGSEQRVPAAVTPAAPAPDTSAPDTPPASGPAAARRARQWAGRQPLRRLTVLYDPDCRLCAFASGWLARQRQLVPLDPVPVGSPEALRRFPALDHRATAKEVTVVGDRGQVYRGDSAWIVCLWALADHREFSHTLTSPAGRRLARAAVLSAAKYREVKGRQPARGGTHREPAPARGPRVQPYGRTTRTGATAGAPSAAPAWVYDGSGGWTWIGPAPVPASTPPAGPPGWTYDEVTGWTQGDTAAGTADCADGCSPSG